MTAAVSACILSLGLLSGGCGKSEPPVKWKMSKELPPDFPSDLPIYPNAKVAAVVSGAGSVIIWETPDALPTVQAYYTKAMSEKGWHVTTYPGVPAPWMGEGGVMVIGTGWGRQIGFALGEHGSNTEITTIVNQ